MSFFTLELPSPFRLDLTVWSLRRQAHNRIDVWQSQTYHRVWIHRERLVGVRLWQTQHGPTARLEGEIYAGGDGDELRAWVISRLRWTLGLDRDMTDFDALAARDPVLGPLALRYRGMRPPRFPSLFEALVNAVACQQVSLNLGITLLNRLAEGCSGGPTGEAHPAHPFPAPEAVLQLSESTLRNLGFSRNKGLALQGLAEDAARGDLEADRWEGLSNADLRAQLCRKRGIGRWSAEYVLLRGLGRLDVFPGDDVGARKSLGEWLGWPEPLDYDTVRDALARWQPYAGLVYFHLLLRRLEKVGAFAGSAEPIGTTVGFVARPT